MKVSLVAIVVLFAATLCCSQIISFATDKKTLNSPEERDVQVFLTFQADFNAKNVTIIGHTRCTSVNAIDRSCQQHCSLMYSHHSDDGLPVWRGNLHYTRFDADGFCHGHLLVTTLEGQERWLSAEAFDTDFGVYLQRGIQPPPRPNVTDLIVIQIDSENSEYEIRAQVHSIVPVRQVLPNFFAECALPLNAFHLESGNHTNGVWLTRVTMTSSAEFCVLSGVSIRDEIDRFSSHLETALLSSNSSAVFVRSIQITQQNRPLVIPKFRTLVVFGVPLPSAYTASLIISDCGIGGAIVWSLSRLSETHFGGTFAVDSFANEHSQCNVSLELRSSAGRSALIRTDALRQMRLENLTFVPHFQKVLPELLHFEISPSSGVSLSARNFSIAAIFGGQGDPFAPDSGDLPSEHISAQPVRLHVSPADFLLAGLTSSPLLLHPLPSSLHRTLSSNSSTSYEWTQRWEGQFQFLEISTAVTATVNKICFPYEFSCVSEAELREKRFATSVTLTTGKNPVSAPSLSGTFDALRCPDSVLIGFALHDETASSCDDSLRMTASFSEMCDMTREVPLACSRDTTASPWFHYMTNVSSRSVVDRVTVLGWRVAAEVRAIVFNRTFTLPTRLDPRCSTFATTTPPRTFILDTYAVSRPPSSARRFPATASILLGLFVVTVLGAAIAILINSFRQQQQASNAALEEKTFML